MAPPGQPSHKSSCGAQSRLRSVSASVTNSVKGHGDVVHGDGRASCLPFRIFSLTFVSEYNTGGAMVDVDYIEGCAFQTETVLPLYIVRGRSGSLYSQIAGWG